MEMKKEEDKKIVVERDGAKDFSFSGVCIATSSSRTNRPDRWTECALYKTAGGSYIYGQKDMTLWEGESVTHSGEKFDSLDKLFKWLEGSEPYMGAVKELAREIGFDLTLHVD
jgi:hypothetical protein